MMETMEQEDVDWFNRELAMLNCRVLDSERDLHNVRMSTGVDKRRELDRWSSMRDAFITHVEREGLLEYMGRFIHNLSKEVI